MRTHGHEHDNDNDNHKPRQDKTRQSQVKTSQVKTRQDKTTTRQDKTRQRQDKTRQDKTRQDKTRQRQDKTRQDNLSPFFYKRKRVVIDRKFEMFRWQLWKRGEKMVSDKCRANQTIQLVELGKGAMHGCAAFANRYRYQKQVDSTVTGTFTLRPHHSYGCLLGCLLAVGT